MIRRGGERMVARYRYPLTAAIALMSVVYWRRKKQSARQRPLNFEREEIAAKQYVADGLGLNRYAG